jgi:hypothetical protein
MIKIFNDFQKTYQDESTSYTRIANQIQEYIPLRQWLRRALNDPDHNYTLYIQRPLLAKWLDDLRSYPSEVVRWESLSLRDGFQQKFGFPPLVELDDSTLKDLGILNLDPPSKNDVADPIGWILGHKLNPVWKTAIPYEGHLANLAAWAVDSQSSHESLLRLARQRLTDWVVHDNRYKFFLTHPLPAAGEAIILRWALRNYPDDFNLRQQQSTTPSEDCRHQTQTVAGILKKYRADLNQFWQMWLIQNSAQVSKAVKIMSGASQVELDILANWLQENPTTLSSDLLDTIRHHFTGMPQLETTLKRLEILVAPPDPQIPQPEWSTEQWLAWATTEYMPYFAWIIRQRQPRDTQMKLADHFADWLVSAYSGLMFAQNPVIVTAQQSHLDHLFTTKQVDVVFWFIIDGLTWWQGQRLAELCTHSGLGIVEMGPHLSALPSVTAISKRAIAQGHLDSSSEKLPVAKLLENRLNLNNLPTSVYTQLSAFEEILAGELQNGIYALLYNALDRHNHDSRHFTADESVDGHLRLITRLANANFQQCLRRGLRAKAIISSDHGSTLLPDSTPVLDTPRFASLLDDNELDELNSNQNLYRRTRACGVEREPNVDELAQLEPDWYLLRSDVFNLPHHFLIPRGYAAVKRRPSGWTHGGATPEETVVPFFEVQPQPLEILTPIVKIDGFLRAAQPGELQITIVNPNPTPLSTVRFNIVDFPEKAEWPGLKPNLPYTYKIATPAATSKDETQILEWLLTVETGGQRRQFSGQETIPVRRFQRSAVDELFI